MDWVVEILGRLVLCFMWLRRIKGTTLIFVGIVVVLTGVFVARVDKIRVEDERVEQKLLLENPQQHAAMLTCARQWASDPVRLAALGAGAPVFKVEIFDEVIDFTAPDKKTVTVALQACQAKAKGR
ncbi:hypothetical protein [Rhizobium sp. RAF56]|uniref:hypothetical protein n=1 Tax=Rhizobium sp. RAF56 TaxID=3233062 RepID=UPI003F99F0DD